MYRIGLDILGKMAKKYWGDILTPDKVRAQHRGSRMGGVVADVEVDEFKACEISEAEDIAELFVEPFYFGCEADDRMNAVAFDKRLNHFDVKF